MSITLRPGDCREVIKGMADSSIDAVVTDPPYALVSITKRFGKPDSAAPISDGATGVYRRAAAGFMGQKWDTGEIAHDPEFWSEVYRVLKPGAHLVAFGGTRTYHRLACAIEDAGFEIRDMVAWIYGTGFPKSHNVGKGIDKAAGAERPVVGVQRQHDIRHHAGDWNNYGEGLAASQREGPARYADLPITAPATAKALRWSGWGTALKPALEPIVLARKPIVGTIAENVLAHGTGAMNVDGCRVETTDNLNGGAYAEVGGRAESPALHGGSGMNVAGKTTGRAFEQPLGRWPANVCHDGSDEVLAAFPPSASQQGESAARARQGQASAERRYTEAGATNFAALPGQRRASAGSTARFFYSAKAGKLDRFGTRHPTVKPVALMRWLCRLVTPPGGVILDPFAGSGTTGIAALAEGFDGILIEREAQYLADISARLAHFTGTGSHSTDRGHAVADKAVHPAFGDDLFTREGTQ